MECSHIKRGVGVPKGRGEAPPKGGGGAPKIHYNISDYESDTVIIKVTQKMTLMTMSNFTDYTVLWGKSGTLLKISLFRKTELMNAKN